MAPGNPAPLSVAVDASGDTYLAGQFYGQTNFDTKNHTPAGDKTATSGSGPDFFVAKYDPTGNLLWVQTGGGPSTDTIYGLNVNSGHVYISGSYIGTKSTLTGLLNQSVFTGSGPNDPNTSKPDGNASDGFVMNLNASDGSFVWGQDIHSTSAQGSDTPSAITSDASGNVYITGYFNGQTNFSGFQPISPSGSSETYVVKMSSSGSVTWVRQFSASGAGQNGSPPAGDHSRGLDRC